MIIVKLGYQFQEDIETYHLPLPEQFETTDQFIMKFNTAKEFFLYSMELTDVRDRLEFEVIMNRKAQKLNKLVFCKKLIKCMDQVKIQTHYQNN